MCPSRNRRAGLCEGIRRRRYTIRAPTVVAHAVVEFRGYQEGGPERGVRLPEEHQARGERGACTDPAGRYHIGAAVRVQRTLSEVSINVSSFGWGHVLR